MVLLGSHWDYVGCSSGHVEVRDVRDELETEPSWNTWDELLYDEGP